jgi:hypothetical protein
MFRLDSASFLMLMVLFDDICSRMRMVRRMRGTYISFVTDISN